MDAKNSAGAAMAASGNENLRPHHGRAKGSITPATWLKMDALADIVAEGDGTVTQAGRTLGWLQQSTSRVWGLIRRELGSQAA